MINPNNPDTRCYEVLRHVDEAVRDVIPENIPYFVLGGVATGALEHSATTFDATTSTICAAEGSDKTIFRDAGSRRDIDVLVLDVLEPAIFERLDHNVASAVGGALVVSTFGIRRHAEHYDTKARYAEAAKRFVSQRTRDESGQDYYEMFPLMQPVQRRSYEPWKLVTPQGYKVDVLNPVGHELAYKMRSIGGPRPKDHEKMTTVHETIQSHPNLMGLVEEGGEFHEWQLFAEFIELLRSRSLPVNHASIHPSSNTVDQLAFRAKANAMHFIEGQEKVVNFALNGPIQKLLNVFVGAGR